MQEINSIEMQIAQGVAEHWQELAAKSLDEAISLTGGSEIAVVIGLIKKLGLDESVFGKMVGTLNENGEPNLDGQIYTSERLSEDIASQINKGLGIETEKNKKILGILSEIHDAWVKKNPNNFLKPGRNKTRKV